MLAPTLPLRLRIQLCRYRRRYREVAERTGRRITSPGMFVLSGYAAALFYVINTRSSMNFQLFSLLLALFVAAHLASLFVRLRSFSAARRLPSYGAVGEPLEYTASVRNEGPRAQTELLVYENARLESGAGLWEGLRVTPDAKTSQSAALDELRPGQAAVARLRLTPLRRGVLRLEGLSIGAADPLGLFRTFRFTQTVDRLLILPKRHPMRRLALGGGRRRQPQGLRLSVTAGDGGDYSALRDYRPGDPLRHIHWPSSARAGRLVVKDYEDAYCVRRALILDTFLRPEGLNHEACERFEDAVSVAASLVAAQQAPDAVLDLLLVADKARLASAGRGLGVVAQLLEALAHVAPRFDGDFRLLRECALAHAPFVSGCVCVFLEWDEQRQALVSALRALRVDALALVIGDATTPALDPGPLADRPERLKILRSGEIAKGLAEL
jgi:uncharacterized protein (DUF58 family)